MKTPNQFNEADEFEFPEKHEVIKTLSMSVAVTEPDLEKAIRVAFDLAKSAGRELDLDFNLPPDPGSAVLPRTEEDFQFTSSSNIISSSPVL
jgi:hypothetical protein